MEPLMRVLAVHNCRRRTLAAIELLCLIALVLVPGAAAGQSPSATVVGQVIDESGGVLPGVTVTLRSPALQVPEVTTMTDERGEYRITPLPIGVYSVEYTLSGFQTVRLPEVRLTTGFSAKLDETMKIGTLGESVTVSGQSPLVDVTQASTATTLIEAALELLPSGTNGIVGLLAFVPGAQTNIEVGGSAITDTNIFASNGQGDEFSSMLEGVFAQASQTGSGGTHYNFNAMEEARVQTSGNGADTPKRGMSVNLITKSGGNTFHGEVGYSGTNHGFESDNINAKLQAQGVKSGVKLVTRKDGGGQLGGRIIMNRLWFFADLRYRKAIREIPFAVRPDGSIIYRPQHQFFQTYKLTGQLNKTNKLIGFWNRYGDSEKRGASQFVPERAMEQVNGRGVTYKAEWQSTIGSWLTLSVQHGFFQHGLQYFGFAPGVPRSVDLVTLKEDGDALSDGLDSVQGSSHDKAVASMYKPNLFKGNHALTVGVDYIDGSRDQNSQTPARRSGDYRLIFSDSSPFELTVYNFPITPRLATRFLGMYVQDSWTINRRLTLSLGIRAQRDRGWVPAQCQAVGTFVEVFPVVCRSERQPNIFKSATPRIHAAFDLTGDGRSVIKGGYGRFVHLRSTGSEISIFNANGQRTTTFFWHDLNNNRDYDPGEFNLNTDFVSSSSPTQAILNSDEKLPGADEYSVGFERQLRRDFAVRVGGVYMREYNASRTFNPLIPYSAYSIPATSRDPGPDGVPNTADDPGTTLTYWTYPTSFGGAANQAIEINNDGPANDSTYKTIEVAATKRLSNGWQLMANYSATKIHSPAAANTPNQQINTENNTWIWIGKLDGSYMFPKGIVGSVAYSIRNGARLARTVLLQAPGTTISTLVVNAEPIGSLNLENVGLLDLRAAKRIQLGQGRTVEILLDCFNAMNVNPVTSIVTRAGPTFGNATASESGGQNGTGLTPPRIFEVGARFRF